MHPPPGRGTRPRACGCVRFHVISNPMFLLLTASDPASVVHCEREPDHDVAPPLAQDEIPVVGAHLPPQIRVHLKSAAEEKLKRTRTGWNQAATAKDDTRVSDAHFLGQQEEDSDQVRAVRQRLHHESKMPFSHFEALQVQRYLPQGYYRPHLDSFDGKERRSVSWIMYLEEPEVCKVWCLKEPEVCKVWYVQEVAAAQEQRLVSVDRF